MRPWNDIPISNIHDPLIDLPLHLHKIQPHYYLSLGAPYGNGLTPWFLRSQVVKRLLIAEQHLQINHPFLRLSIFDAWRPIEVQAFMIDFTISQECNLRGLNRSNPSDSVQFNNLINEVYRFWAPANSDPSSPPPHSTGAAVDLTLAYLNGTSLFMGSNIDVLGPISEPNYFKSNHSSPLHSLWHSRRLILADSMKYAGFAQHPTEWWHFSFGDQLWAWITKNPEAYYGSTSGVDKSS